MSKLNAIRFIVAVMAASFACSGAVAGQKVFLDFSGTTTGNPDGTLTGTKVAFQNSPVVTGFVNTTDGDNTNDTAAQVADTMMDAILAKMESDYAGFWVDLVKAKPTSGAFSAIDFGSGTDLQGDLGIADSVDLGNMNTTDSAWVLVDAHTGMNQGQSINELANTGSHELGHLFGLEHDDGDNTEIMNGDFDGVDKGFSLTSKFKLALNAGLHVAGVPVSTSGITAAAGGLVNRFVNSLTSGFTTAANRLTLDFNPSGGSGAGALQISGDLGDNPFDPNNRTDVTGGTVLNSPQGYHGEAFQYEDALGNFLISLPKMLDVTGVDGDGLPIFDGGTIFFDPIVAGFGRLPGIQIDISEFRYAELDLVHSANSTPRRGAGDSNEANTDLTEVIAALVAVNPQVSVDPFTTLGPSGLLAGSFAELLQSLLDNGILPNFLITTNNLGDLTNGFTTVGSVTGEASLAAIVPEPSSGFLVLFMIIGGAAARYRRVSSFGHVNSRKN